MGGIAFLCLFAGLALWFSRTTSATFDEPGFIVAGYSYWQREGPEISATNLRLVPLGLTLPLLLEKRHLPDRITSSAQLVAHQDVQLGREFLADERNDGAAILHACRTSNIAIGVILGFVIFAWSRRLHGDAAGLLAVGLYSLNPVLISNSAIATTDVAITLLFVVAVASLWRLLHRISVATMAGAGVACGALATSKLSWPLIVPIFAVMLTVRLLVKRRPEFGWPWAATRTSTRGTWLIIAGAILLTGVIAFATIWAIYGFRFSRGLPLPAEYWVLSTRPDATLVQRAIGALHHWRLLPEGYLFDLQTFSVTSGLRRAFLMGDYSVDGWWYFFPVVWFFKTPLAFLMALFLSLGTLAWSVWKKRLGQTLDLYALTPLGALGVVYAIAAMMGTLNLGIRHFLPVYPLLFVLAGVGTRLPYFATRPKSFVIGALIVWSASELEWSRPDYLAYANLFAGGSKNGYRVMADSSYEWGQDLPALEKWLAARNARPGPKSPVFFSYFGSADLRRYRIEATLLPQYAETRPPKLYPIGAGTYVISATMLQALYGVVMGPWRPSLEERYQAFTKEMIRVQEILRAGGREAFDRMIQTEGSAPWLAKSRLYDELRFGRLCAWLRRRQPTDRITYGLLVYELSDADVHAALFEPPAELRLNYAIKGAEKASEEYLQLIK